jgi:hypothetical protein
MVALPPEPADEEVMKKLVLAAVVVVTVLASPGALHANQEGPEVPSYGWGYAKAIWQQLIQDVISPWTGGVLAR